MNLNLNTLFEAAMNFADDQSSINHLDLRGVTDGKAVGTYIEHKFENYLIDIFPDIQIGNSASGIDLPDSRINCDLKTTSINQPQSSCPYKDTKQKIYGLGYNLIVFVYDKEDTPEGDCYLHFINTTLIEEHRTADYTLTKMINEMIDAGANADDLMGLFIDKSLPGDEITLSALAQEVLNVPPEQGYLTISNALQWRLQYRRVIGLDNQVEGVLNYDR